MLTSWGTRRGGIPGVCTGVGTAQVSWLQEEEEEEEDASHLREGGGRLPVLQFSGHALGEAAAEQPDQEEHAHAERHHQQDVVLGRGGHHLHGQVREALGRRHLQARRRRAAKAA